MSSDTAIAGYGTAEAKSPFQELESVLLLAEAGRKHTAKSVWDKLPEDFRKAVLRFALACIANVRAGLQVACEVTFKTRYGYFTLTDGYVTRLTKFLPEIVCG